MISPLPVRRTGAGLALLLAGYLTAPLAAQQGPPPVTCDEGFALYDNTGAVLTWTELLTRASKADAVFLGEDHDDRRAHCLQERIFRALHAASSRPLVLSLEMFERDTQTVLDEYLSGIIDEKLFLAAARPWPNYKEDYRPLVEFARQHKIPVVAANAPRRYVTVTARKGPAALNELSPLARSWLPPLPLAPASEAYRNHFGDVMGNLNPAGPCADAAELAKGAEKPDPHSATARHGTTPSSPKPAGMPSWDNLIASQSLWDAAMADSIANAIKRHPGALVVHLNGGFHSEEGMGIIERLAQYRPATKTFAIGLYPRREFRNFDTDLRDVTNAIVLTDCSVYRKKQR